MLFNIDNSKSGEYISYKEYSLPMLERIMSKDSQEGPQDENVTTEELNKVLKGVINGKSTAMDMINNEMWKCGGTLLHKAVVHMFNIILKYGVYPQKWKPSIVTPIHNSLDIGNPCNYIGVAVAYCINKIFCKVINIRIIRYL